MPESTRPSKPTESATDLPKIEYPDWRSSNGITGAEHWSSLAQPVVDGILDLLQRGQPGSRHHVCMADLQNSNLLFSDAWFNPYLGGREETAHYLKSSGLTRAFRPYPAEAMTRLLAQISIRWQEGLAQGHSGSLSILHWLMAPDAKPCPVVTQCRPAPMLIDDTGPILIANVTEVRHLAHVTPSPILSVTLTFGSRSHHWHLDTDSGEIVEKPTLSASEVRVLDLVAEGKSSRDIAQAINTSPSTVDTHRRNICRKLGSVDTTAAVQLCLLMGWL